MKRGAVALAATLTIAGCDASTPVRIDSTAPLDTPGPTTAATAQPSHAALRNQAAAALGIDVDQLVLVEDGFVAARFRVDTELELVWIGPVDGALQDRLLAALPERRAGPSQSLGSVYAAVCPPGLGLVRSRFLFGQETSTRRLDLSGLAAVGGDVIDGTYVFAIADPSDGSTNWSVKDSTGRELSNGPVSWLTSTTAPAGGDACAVTSEH